MKIYHGTDKSYDKFELIHAQNYKDFGRGWYLADNFEFAAKNARKHGSLESYVMVYEINMVEIRELLRVKEFKKVSTNWIKFIIANRIKIIEPTVDIVIGPTADSNAQELIELFYRRFKNRTPSMKEYKELIKRVMPNVYPRQFCFLTDRSIEYLNSKYVKTITL